MSLNKRFFSILTVAVVFVAFSTVSFAQDDKATTSTDKAQKERKFDGKQGRKGMHGGKFGRHGGKFHGLRGINLTDAQKEQIKAIRQANMPDKAVLDELRAIHQSRKSGADLTAEQKTRIGVIRDQMRTKHQQVRDQIQNVLTVEQKAEIEKMKVERKQRMEQFRQKRDGFRKQRELKQKPAGDVTTVKPKIS